MIRFLALVAVLVMAVSVPANAHIANRFLVYSDAPTDANDTSDASGTAAYAPPEIDLPVVKFLKMPPPHNLKDQIDRLVQGIQVDMPPEYDYYGYEIRRYMAHVGGTAVYTDPIRRHQEEQNIKNAQIVLSYWFTDLHKQMAAIQAAIDKENGSSTLRSSFNYNSGVIGAFQVECQSWLNNNQALLKFLDDYPSEYSFHSPYLIFNHTESHDAFEALFNARELAHKQISERQPFASIVY